MQIKFYKYHGTGNDFIMIEDRHHELESQLSQEKIALWCHRRFGIGADGLILLQSDDTADFFMKYYNSDGRPSSMCGNGGRCISKFALDRGWIEGSQLRFRATDGMHHAQLVVDNIELSMSRVDKVTNEGDTFILDTGSPHYVKFDDVNATNIYQVGKDIRYSDRFKTEGINVNIAQLKGDHISMLTYERGVEDETYSCGTGTVAVAIASLIYSDQPDGRYEINISTKGGTLRVRCNKQLGVFDDILLIGQAINVFEGFIDL